jgi:hypothetical protein
MRRWSGSISTAPAQKGDSKSGHRQIARRPDIDPHQKLCIKAHVDYDLARFVVLRRCRCNGCTDGRKIELPAFYRRYEVALAPQSEQVWVESLSLTT